MLVKDQFIDALPAEDMWLWIWQNRWQALEAALELELYVVVVSRRTKPVREVLLEERSPVAEDECSEAEVFM